MWELSHVAHNSCATAEPHVARQTGGSFSYVKSFRRTAREGGINLYLFYQQAVSSFFPLRNNPAAIKIIILRMPLCQSSCVKYTRQLYSLE